MRKLKIKMSKMHQEMNSLWVTPGMERTNRPRLISSMLPRLFLLQSCITVAAAQKVPTSHADIFERCNDDRLVRAPFKNLLLNKANYDAWNSFSFRTGQNSSAPAGSASVAKSDCGMMDADLQGILGGEVSPDLAWPWQASFGGICGAALISPQWIITAAHCVKKNKKVWKVFLDRKVAPGGKAKDTLRQTIKSRKIFVHKDRRVHDVALVKLRKPAKLNSRVRPICLPSPGMNFFSTRVKCYASGYGESEGRRGHLRHVQVSLLEFSKCKLKWGKYLSRNYICLALPSTPGAGPCRGDSGGPLSCTADGKQYFLAGVTSFGSTNCSSIRYPDAYIKVSFYLPWIQETKAGESKKK